MTDLCSTHTAQRTSFFLQPRLLPGTQPGLDDMSHWMRLLDTNRWVKMVQSLPGDRGRGQLPRLQSSVLATLGFSPARGFPKDA
ncbi:hypothetical protein FOXYSP1_19522 [Fusarium oxysporum f. sp. phaseoli]